MRIGVGFMKALRLAVVVIGCVALMGRSVLAEALNPFAAKPLIVATIKPLALMAQSLVGDAVTVRTLLPASANPHAQALSIADRQGLADADLVIWIGPSFERFLAKSMGQHKKAQLVLGQLPGLAWPGAEGDDLHLWLDPHNIEVALQAIAQQLKLLDPLGAPSINLRLQQALLALADARHAIVKQFEPYKGAPFAVSHDGYGHFVHAFGLNQVAAVTRLPEQQLGAKRMVDLQSQLVAARCLVVEPNDLRGYKLAATLQLKSVEIDALGRDSAVTSIPLLLQSVAAGVVQCLALTSQ